MKKERTKAKLNQAKAYAGLILLALFAGTAGYWIVDAKTDIRLPQLTALDALPGISKKPDPQPVKLLFVGDMMFDRSVRFTIKQNGGAATSAAERAQNGFDHIFGEMPKLFAQYDLVVGNLEGPVTDFSSKTTNAAGRPISGFQFTFQPETAEALKRVGMDIVSLANNHTDNFGQAGLRQTRERLAAAGVQYFGSPANDQDVGMTTCVTISESQKTCIGLVGWHEFSKRNNESVITAIHALASTTDYIVVMPHWGVEYEGKPTATQRTLARQWIDAGADAIIGAHPHVVQTVELYRDKTIFYSLGNFMFDQYFSFDTTHGIGVEVTLSPALGTSTADSAVSYVPYYKVLPFENVRQRFSFPSAENAQKILKRLEDLSRDANGNVPPVFGL